MKNSHFLLTILILALFTNNLSTQEYVASFKPKVIGTDVKNTVVSSISLEINTLISTDLTSVKIDTAVVYSFSIDTYQEFYEKYLDGEVLKSDFLKYNLDTISIQNKLIKNNIIYLLVGLDKERKNKYLVLDSNCNLDFNDDKLYTYSLDNFESNHVFFEKNQIWTQLYTKQYNGKSWNPLAISVGLRPFPWYKSSSYSSLDDYYLKVEMHSADIQQAHIQINNKDVTINASGLSNNNLVLKDINTRSDFIFSTDTLITRNTLRALGDTIQIADRRIHLREIKNNKLYLDDLGSLIDSSYIGSRAPFLRAENIQTNISIELNTKMKGKYIFIDFWGSWCRPCIAGIPKLKEIYDKVKDREDVLFMGIAAEDDDDLPKLENLIKTHNISWLNAWTDINKQKQEESILAKLKISSYPSYVILDKEGKIVFHSSYNYNDDALDFFLKLIDSE